MTDWVKSVHDQKSADAAKSVQQTQNQSSGIDNQAAMNEEVKKERAVLIQKAVGAKGGTGEKKGPSGGEEKRSSGDEEVVGKGGR